MGFLNERSAWTRLRYALNPNPIILMNIRKSVLGLVAASASFFAACVVVAQSGATKPITTPAMGAPAQEKQQKLVKVSTLTTAEANQEFQRNVQIVQAQRQAVIELNQAFEKETNAAKKKEAKAKLDEKLKELNDNNQKMIKAYGFSLDRNYTMVIETSHIYMFVSDEEAAKFEKEAAAAAAAAKAAPAKK